MTDIPSFEKYPFHIDLFLEGEGEGCTITFPDLPGCIADGTTEKEAIANARDAFNAWMSSALKDQAPIPAPHSAPIKNPDRSDAFSLEQRARISANIRARGMTIEVFLPEDLADWLRAKLATGVYKNAKEAAYLALMNMRDIDHHPEVRRALLTAMIEDGAKSLDAGQAITIEEVRADFRAMRRQYADTEPPSK